MTSPNTSITNTNSFYTQIAAPQKMAAEPIAKQETKQPEIEQPKVVAKEEPKGDFFDKISEKVVNPKDISDTVKMPRTIFKGYLSFMIGSTLMFMANPIKDIKGFKTISKFLNFAGLGATIVGTYEFVKPFLLKGKKEEDKKA